jgi:hypothetical protein
MSIKPCCAPSKVFSRSLQKFFKLPTKPKNIFELVECAATKYDLSVKKYHEIYKNIVLNDKERVIAKIRTSYINMLSCPMCYPLK